MDTNNSVVIAGLRVVGGGRREFREDKWGWTSNNINLKIKATRPSISKGYTGSLIFASFM